MINLTPYTEDPFEFHKNVVDKKKERKDDADYKQRLIDLLPQLTPHFTRYSELSEENDLESISSMKLNKQEKKDLISLYAYRLKVFQEFKVKATTKNGRKFNLCQMCTVEPVGSIDHILPKEEFPEFVVNPLNLFPCCLTCNSIKGKRWLREDERLFLNLYYDQLPNEEYLQVDFSPYPVPLFSINKKKVKAKFYKLIDSHFNQLDLPTRFRETSSEIIDPLIGDARNLVPKIGIDQYRQVIAESTKEMQTKYGINHWKTLLKKAVVNHQDFKSYIK